MRYYVQRTAPQLASITTRSTQRRVLDARHLYRVPPASLSLAHRACSSQELCCVADAITTTYEIGRAARLDAWVGIMMLAAIKQKQEQQKSIKFSNFRADSGIITKH
jgi:hypothetical protein